MCCELRALCSDLISRPTGPGVEKMGGRLGSGGSGGSTGHGWSSWTHSVDMPPPFTPILRGGGGFSGKQPGDIHHWLAAGPGWWCGRRVPYHTLIAHTLHVAPRVRGVTTGLCQRSHTQNGISL